MKTTAYRFIDDPHTYHTRVDIGMPGRGKTHLLRVQLESIHALGAKRIVVFDPTEHDFHFGKFNMRVVRSVAEVHKILFGSKVKLDTFRLRVVTRTLNSEQASKLLDYVCWALMRHYGDSFLLVDEIHTFCPSKSGTSMQPPEFDNVVTKGRNERIRVLVTCQRPTQVHNNLILNCDEMNIFRTKDLQLLKGELATPGNLDIARGLDKFQFFCCRDGEAELCTVKRN